MLPEWLEVERVIAREDLRGGIGHYLCKWRGLGYAEATWEYEYHLKSEADDVRWRLLGSLRLLPLQLPLSCMS